MIQIRLVKILMGLTLLGGSSALSCGARTEDHATDTKTNWLENCSLSDDCDDGFTCLCGVCTVACSDADACEKFGGEAACYHAECATRQGVCALPDTPLENSAGHGAPDAGSMVTCPHLRESYTAMGEECGGLQLDCAPTFLPFQDVCGCGCDANRACDPTLAYVAYGNQCDTIDYDCVAGENHFRDECGCGCQPPETPDCPREADAYLLTGAQCDSAAVDCSPGFEYFRDDCGCGCEETEAPPECPRENDAYLWFGEECDTAGMDCFGDQYFRDDCGCGCETTVPVCTREGNTYLSFGEECDTAEIDCSLGAQYFRDDCGCGCEPNPACDPDVDYVVSAGGCTLSEISCDEAQLVVTDDCGCGCKPNPACDPDVEYKFFGGCAGAIFGCPDGEEMVFDDCGCGCTTTGNDVDGGSVGEGSVDGGTITDACLPPEGTSVDTTLLFQTTCIALASVHRVVGTQEEFDQAMAECGAQMVFAPGFSGTPLYITTVPDRDSARHLYTVQTDSGLELGMEYAAYCEGARPPTLLFVFEVDGLTYESTIIEGVCMSDECSGLPRP